MTDRERGIIPLSVYAMNGRGNNIVGIVKTILRIPVCVYANTTIMNDHNSYYNNLDNNNNYPIMGVYPKRTTPLNQPNILHNVRSRIFLANNAVQRRKRYNIAQSLGVQNSSIWIAAFTIFVALALASVAVVMGIINSNAIKNKMVPYPVNDSVQVRDTVPSQRAQLYADAATQSNQPRVFYRDVNGNPKVLLMHDDDLLFRERE